LKVLKIKKKIFGEDHVEYAMTLQNLSNVLSDLSDYEGAKEGYLEALEIIRRSLGEDNVEYATTLGNLSFAF
jgi:tetratricopeptide (TPR) repeat protein